MASSNQAKKLLASSGEKERVAFLDSLLRVRNLSKESEPARSPQDIHPGVLWAKVGLGLFTPEPVIGKRHIWRTCFGNIGRHLEVLAASHG